MLPFKCRSQCKRRLYCFGTVINVLTIVLTIWPSTSSNVVHGSLLNPFSSLNPFTSVSSSSSKLMNPMKVFRPFSSSSSSSLKLMKPMKALSPFSSSSSTTSSSSSLNPLKALNPLSSLKPSPSASPAFPLEPFLTSAASTIASSLLQSSGLGSPMLFGGMPNQLLASAATNYISSVYSQYYNNLLKNPKSLLDPQSAAFNVFNTAQNFYNFQPPLNMPAPPPPPPLEDDPQMEPEQQSDPMEPPQDQQPDSQTSASGFEYIEASTKPQQSHPNLIPVNIPLMDTASKYSMKYHPAAKGTYLWKKKKVKHHHYHPVIIYKKKKIPGKYWHEAQRRLVTKHGGLDVLGDIIQLPNGKVLSSNIGQNIPNFNDGYFKPWELRVRLENQQREMIMNMLKRIEKILEDPPKFGLFVVKEISLLP